MEPGAAQLALFAAVLLASGVLAGWLSGLLGVGGGIVVVPVLYHGFGALGIDPTVRMHVVVATSLATVVVTAFRSARSHASHGALDAALLRAWAPAAAAGALLGTAAAARVTGATLEVLFGALALVFSLHLAFGRESWRLADTPPAGAPRALLGAAIGALSAMLGLGGGTLGVTTFTLCGVPIHRAVATAAGLGVAIALPGALGLVLAGLGVPGRPPGSLGYVNLVGFALIVPATWWAAPRGARAAHRLPTLALRRAFAAFLALSALRMLVEAL